VHSIARQKLTKQLRSSAVAETAGATISIIFCAGMFGRRQIAVTKLWLSSRLLLHC